MSCSARGLCPGRAGGFRHLLMPFLGKKEKLGAAAPHAGFIPVCSKCHLEAWPCVLGLPAAWAGGVQPLGLFSRVQTLAGQHGVLPGISLHSKIRRRL